MRGTETYNKPNNKAGFDIKAAGDVLHVKAWGQWTLNQVTELDAAFSQLVDDKPYYSVEYNLEDVSALDTSGAYILARAIRCDSEKCFDWRLTTADKGQHVLIEAAEKAALGRLPPPARPWYELFARTGEAVSRFGLEP